MSASAPAPRWSPRRLFRTVATAEAITWALLLLGMFLKYVTETTELGVRVFGLMHGVVFIAYVVTTFLVAVDQKWSAARTGLSLAAAIPPFFTLLAEWSAERSRVLSSAWRLQVESPGTAAERFAAWLINKPVRGLGVGVAAVLALTAVALVVGPPGG